MTNSRRPHGPYGGYVKEPHVTETIDSTPAAPEASTNAPKKRGGGLNSMLIADLKSMASGMGIAGAGSMKKAQLVDAIKSAQGSGGQRSTGRSQAAQDSAAQDSGAPDSGAQPEPTTSTPQVKQRPARQRQPRTQDQQSAPAAQPVAQEPAQQPEQATRPSAEQPAAQEAQRPKGGQEQRANRGRQDHDGQDQGKQDQGKQDQGKQDQAKQDQAKQDQAKQEQHRQGRQDRQEQARQDQQDQDRQHRQDENRQDQDRQNRQDQNRQDEQPGEGSRRNRRRRGRDRDAQNVGGQGAVRDASRDTSSDTRDGRDGRDTNRGRGGQRHEPDTTILEDDVLVPAAGILDVLDNYAFVRTSGYLPGNDDVYVSLSMVRKYGLRRGDALIGEVRQPREGESKAKFNPMVRIESVNGAEPETAKHRVEFQKLTPLYPSERLRLETVPGNLIGRVIDIAAPIGKGQRGLIVSPAKAGKTMILQSIANSITTNNPECHLMVVLVDERPEEVTDFERSVKGEVISSTFDRPAVDHTMVAELAIERAKRLVELGHDVVVLLDGITRLGRAYNLAAPASGRILSGGVDSAALYPPKRFFGAARNIENGGSLTILATALIESGSKMDEVIFEEFKGTGNMEIRLRRDFADKRIFPAIDAVQSGTRREELLMSEEELAIVWKLRRVLSGLDGQQALELLLGRLKKASTNIEFLLQVQKSTPQPGSHD
jgi:transcription termination factor Rho